MKKKMNNKGFTLVELIVVLVILAILAAILVPTLLGYIDRAKKEKDFSTAQTIRVAYQSAIADAYAKWNGTGTLTVDEKVVWQLIGATPKTGEGAKGATLDGVDVSIESVKLDDTDNTFQIIQLQVKINNSDYYMYKNEWSATKPSGWQ